MEIDKSKLSAFGLKFNRFEFGHGSFQAAMFDAFLKASEGNKERIANAFSEWFNELDITLDYPYLPDNLKYFAMELNSDSGKAYLKTAAKDKKTAISNTMKVENCPFNAIRAFEVSKELWTMPAKGLVLRLQKFQ